MAHICIVMATYNGEKYLPQMLDSLVAQTMQPYKVIVVDDGSKDSTVAILKKYQNSLPLEVFTLSENNGHRVAFSKGLEIAQQEMTENDYIVLADHDDVWLPRKLEILKEALEKSSKASLVFGDAQVIDGENNPIADSWQSFGHINLGNSIRHQIAGINHVTGCLSIFKASLLKIILPIPDGVSVHDRWIAMIAEKNGGIQAISDKILQYRIHGNNAVGGRPCDSMSQTLKNQQKWISAILENKNRLKLTDKEISFAERLLAITASRLEKPVVLGHFFWSILNRTFLFNKAGFFKTLKRILFSQIGLPLAKTIWSKN